MSVRLVCRHSLLHMLSPSAVKTKWASTETLQGKLAWVHTEEWRIWSGSSFGNEVKGNMKCVKVPVSLKHSLEP